MKTIYLLFIIQFFYSLVIAQPPYNVYWGNLHSHTSYSDGEGTPAEAFDYAKNVAHIDFLAVTDHLEQIYYEIFPSEWEDMKDAADNATVNGVFVGIAGYEWASPQHGHCNVFNTPNMVTPTTFADWPAFCQDVVDEYPAFAQFNHPGEEMYFSNWNNFAYLDSTIDASFCLIEVHDFSQATWYFTALDAGWHVSPVANQDNHSADWGTKNDHRAGVWSTELTRPALFDAMMAGRTFATWDKNAKIWIDINSQPMGQIVQRDYDMPLHIFLDDADTEQWQSIDVIGNLGPLTTFSSVNSNVDTTIYVTPENINWLIVRACQTDSQFLWSAPIYFTGVLTHATDYSSQLTGIKIFPNPTYQNVINISFNLLSQENVSMYLKNILGENIYEMPAQLLTAGNHKFFLKTDNINSNIYFVSVQTDSFSAVEKVILIK